MDRLKIMVTGANGQLGRELRSLAPAWPRYEFVFLAKADLDIHRANAVTACFETVKPAYCINCAAYTAVDRAETEKETAMLVNGEAVGVLAGVCALFKTGFIHLSTDYVFDGTATVPYAEDASPHPVNYYGGTKRRGEELALKNNKDSIIIRTSWVYSEFGNNFVKTMLRLMSERESLNVVNDQFGSPTYAADLAAAMLHIIDGSHTGLFPWEPGIYHYSNEGVISWYDFAVAISEITGSNSRINPIPTSAYPTPAKRPAFSVLSNKKIQAIYYLTLCGWKKSLFRCLSRL
jgi:dTDP-4-dehydrorhamnose reductase